MKGRLITLEGGEGAGKSTQARFISAWLEARGRTVVQTREPGGSPLAEAIRGVVLGDWQEGVTPACELLLIYAARAAHLQATILPALARGEDVVCDRFIDASWAYQGAGRGIPEASIAAVEQLVLGGLRPDLTLIFDLAPQIGIARANRRGANNRFEGESAAFMQRVRAAYLQRAGRDPARYAIIDASAELAAVQAQLSSTLEQRL
jgi:dTMP kinase